MHKKLQNTLLDPFHLKICFHQCSMADTQLSFFLLSPCMQNDRSPQLVTNSLVWVPQGGMLQISKTILHAELPGARDSEITYTIIKDQPRHGKYLWIFCCPKTAVRRCFSPRMPHGVHPLNKSARLWLLLVKRVFFTDLRVYDSSMVFCPQQRAFEGIFPYNTMRNRCCSPHLFPGRTGTQSNEALLSCLVI